MKELFNSPVFGILISIAAYEIGLLLYRKTKLPILNPYLVCITIIIAFLMVFDIDFESYNKGGSLISMFLGPSTVILAVPLYKQRELLKANIVPIITGITAGCLTSLIGVIVLSKFINLEEALTLSLLPKSITTPVGVELSKQLGGIPGITIVGIIITGVFGGVFGPSILKLFKIKDSVAVGISIGTSAHALGTTKAVEIGEKEGAMSGLALGIAALVTVFLTPLVLRLLK